MDDIISIHVPKNPSLEAMQRAARSRCSRRSPRAMPASRRTTPSIQRIGFHSLLNVRSRTATKTRLTSHIAIRRGWPT